MKALKVSVKTEPPARSQPLLDAWYYREWMARHLQHNDVIGGGIPWPWEKISPESKEKWRKLADGHAASIASLTQEEQP